MTKAISSSPAVEAEEMTEHVSSPGPAQRFELRIPVQYRVIGEPGWLKGMTENISRSGVLLHTDQPLEPNAQVEITLLLPFELFGLHSTEVLCRAEVVRTISPEAEDTGAMAAKFLDYQFHPGAQIGEA